MYWAELKATWQSNELKTTLFLLPLLGACGPVATETETPSVEEIVYAPSNIPSCEVENVETLFLTVIDTADLPDADLSDDVCASIHGTCTLRAAVEQANATAAPFTHIAVSGGDYQLSIPAGLPDPTCTGTTCMIEDEDDAAMGDLDINVPSCIVGRARDSVVIRAGSNVGRAFHVHSSASSSDFPGVVIRDLTVKDGYAPAFWGMDPIYSMVAMTGCQSGEDACSGGAIRNQGSLFLQQVVLRENASNGNGNAILNSSEMVISNSVIEENRDELGHGGGVLNQDMLTVQYSTFDGNRTDSSGGAIANMGGIVDVLNSTFHANETPWEGAAVSNAAGGQMSILFSTFANNVSSNTGATIYAGEGQIIFKNSIVADSTGANCAYSPGNLAIVGANLSTDATCPGFLVDLAYLQPLSVVGGGPNNYSLQTRTPTLAPDATSPVVDLTSDCTDWSGIPVLQDQRGESRQSGPCDLGAHEL